MVFVGFQYRHYYCFFPKWEHNTCFPNFLKPHPIEVLASFPACFRNSAFIWSSPGDFLFFNYCIASWSAQSLIGQSNRPSVVVGFALPFFCIRVLYSPLTIFDFLLAYVPSFCACVNVHVNAITIPLSLVITSLFLCIGILFLQNVLFWILVRYLQVFWLSFL